MIEEIYELPPVLVVAQADSLSIRKGYIYQFREYTEANYRRWGSSIPPEPLGTLEGIGGTPPCCVHYPKRLTTPIDPPPEYDWL